ncbi:ABC transporter related protein [Thermaerobacter marianensis DSM 12885]|uniref:ABC transporter related protein n=1 Tax=Thermaerobacter marianensis (strain ATCC 700841 / DSM 12885 / JCM 10246 / 7p75a) TaxID=644966 RepID=E6SI60_THEM7|nr:ABC transporter ATP-binding protein [Thermaerobacter marianensis]ADU50838.1 ABC transporter related protein [Thermaerobacter marianensis DSM 12885]
MDALLRLKGVSHRFGAVEALRHVDLALPAGTLTALIGPDGAGKTTLLRIAAGVLTPTAGRVVRPSAGIGYLAGSSSVYPDLSVWQNLTFFGRLYGMHPQALSREAERLLAWTDLDPFRHRLARNLSGGMRQKLGLACALIHRPAVALLDEPTTGVDPLARDELWKLLRELARNGMAVLVATPYFGEAELCPRVALLAAGRILATGSPAEIRARVPYRMGILQPAADVQPAAVHPPGHEAAPTAHRRRRQLLKAARRLPGVVDARIVGAGVRFALAPDAPTPEAPSGTTILPAEPTLEDAYLWLSQVGPTAAAAAAVGTGAGSSPGSTDPT